MNKKVPYSLRLLRKFCPPQLLEEIEGDLLQKFERDVKLHGERKAKRKLLWNTIRFLRPGIILRNKYSYNLTATDMYKSYFKIMMRNMINQKLYTLITTLGLTIGISFTLLIGVFIWGELQVNSTLKDVERLYLLETKYEKSEGNNPPFFVPGLLGQFAVEQYPTFFENFYRFRDRGITISKEDTHLRVQSMIGDSTFFHMFGFPVLHGNSEKALHAPDAIVVTEKIARQFFNRTDVIGETLTISTENSGLKEYSITAVIANLQPKNSISDFMNMDAQVFLAQENRADFNLGFQDEWGTSIITYIKLATNVQPEEAKNALNKLLVTYIPESVAERRSIELNAIKTYYLATNNGAVQKLIIALAVVVFFILLLAITNFINISIASSFSRLKEVGVRKVIGGGRKQVIFQFISESVLLATLSGILSLVVYQLLHTQVGNVLDTSLPTLFEMDITFWMSWVIGTLLIGLLAGLYPSVYLSATRTIDSLKGKFKSVNTTLQLSRGLVGIQFLIAIFILITSMVVSRQISYFMEADLGYDKSFVLVVSSVPRIWNNEGFDKMEVAKSEFLKSPHVASVSLSWGAPNFNFSPFQAKINRAGESNDEGVLTTLAANDEHYAKVYALNMLEGKFFFEEGEVFQADRLVLNEAAQKALNVKVGDKVNIQFSDKEFFIAGIVKDFHFDSMHEAVKPLAFTHTRDFQAYRYFSIKLKSTNLYQSIASIEESWKTVFPNDPFDYGFIDERLAITYKTELQLKKASVIGSILILIIVLTGVLGLVSLSVAKRSKEIGIRKVLGATAANILALVSREYSLLMVIAFMAGGSLSYGFISQWLDGFAYHIELKWWMFALPGVSLLIVTLLVIILQAYRAAQANPVKTLRSE